MTKVATWSELEDRAPAYALVEGVDLVVWSCPAFVDGWTLRFSLHPSPEGERSFPREAGE